MNKNLGILVGENLDLDLIYTLTVSEYEISGQGHRNAKTIKHLLSRGFEKYDYLYGDVKSRDEFKKGIFRIVLIGK